MKKVILLFLFIICINCAQKSNLKKSHNSNETHHIELNQNINLSETFINAFNEPIFNSLAIFYN